MSLLAASATPESDQETGDFLRAVLDGLSQRPRSIPPKFFYDETGSRLFEKICQAPEYYPTRTELGILHRHAEAIARRVGSGCVLVEPGSGSSDKLRALLGHLRPRQYVPVDISGTYMRKAAAALARDYPWLPVRAACADFTRASGLLSALPGGGRRVVFFPGSSIGNFEMSEARKLLGLLARAAGQDGGLLIGVDLQKDPAVLEAAYDDAAGVTAAFNLNLLARANRQLQADFDLQGFAHRAVYDPGHARVQMYLDSLRSQRVTVAGRRFDFRAQESIHTENAYKYTVEGFSRLAASAGFRLEEAWTDERGFFSVQYYAVAGARRHPMPCE